LINGVKINLKLFFFLYYLETSEMIEKAIEKIDKSTQIQLEKINQKKQEELQKLEKKFETIKKVKTPLTYLVIVVLSVLVFFVVFLDSFRLIKFMKYLIAKRSSKVAVNSSQLLNQIEIEEEDYEMKNKNIVSEYDLYKSFLIAKYNRSMK